MNLSNTFTMSARLSGLTLPNFDWHTFFQTVFIVEKNREI